MFTTHFMQIMGFSFIPHHEWFGKRLSTVLSSLVSDHRYSKNILTAQFCLGACVSVHACMCVHVRVGGACMCPCEYRSRSSVASVFHQGLFIQLLESGFLTGT